jgi:hypothetical protein
MTTVREIKEVKKFALDHGMFVVEKGADFLLYRRTPARNVRLGCSRSVARLQKLAVRCASTQS